MTSVTSSNSISKEHTIRQKTVISAMRPTQQVVLNHGRFFNILFPHRTKSVNIQRNCDTIFQVIHYVTHYGKKHSPFHVGLVELFHDDSRVKLVIGFLNKIGLYISYDELQRLDIGLMNRVMNVTGSNRVPVSFSIDKKTLIYGAMDNFDHTEVISSGIGGSHDTILILFQNQNENENSPKARSKKPTGSLQNQKSTDKILPCQEIIKMGKFGVRGKIPETSSPGDEMNLSWKKNQFAEQYRLWILARYKDKSPLDNGPHIQSFVSVKSLLDSSTHFITKCAFTPILPYPVTEYDAILTTMINFQDVPKQKERENGPLWSDEGVYHIAKEIQLLYPQKFGNTFPRIGGFHLQKVVIGLGMYLELSGIQNLLLKKVYAVVNSVMSGGNYIRGKGWISLIAEAMEQLQVYSFLHSSHAEIFSELFDKIDKLMIMMRVFPTKTR